MTTSNTPPGAGTPVAPAAKPGTPAPQQQAPAQQSLRDQAIAKKRTQAMEQGPGARARTQLPTPANDNDASEETEESAGAEDLGDDELEALTEREKPAEEMIQIGEHKIPLSILEQIPDEHLMRIKRKVKAGGKELEITLAQALEAVPQAVGWRKRQWEAAQKEKRLEQIAQRFGDDAIGAYQALYGVTSDQAIDALGKQLLSRYERERMSPEERAKVERMEELERKAARAEELERKEQERVAKEEQARLSASYRQQMAPALKAAGLNPSSKHAIARVAAAMAVDMEEGVIGSMPQAEDFARAARAVAKEIEEERGEWLPSEADGNALIERVGEDAARKIAKAYATRLRAKQETPTRSGTNAGPVQKPSKQKRARTWAEWQAQANRRQGLR